MTKGAKRAIRAQVLDKRRAKSDELRADAGLAIAHIALRLPEVAGQPTVAAYWSFGSEPPTQPLLNALVARGVRVLLPVGTADGDLSWAPYTSADDLTPGRWSLLEPTNPALGADAIGTASLVLVPALAVDRAGRRLGRGAGAYDRALTRVTSGVPRLAILYDGELVAGLPDEAHDQRVDGVVTPSGTVRF